MVKVEKLIQGLRQESRFAQYFGIAAFLLVPIAMTLTSLQGRTGNRDDHSEMSFLMLLGFLALAYGRLTRWVAQVAEAFELDQDPTH